MKRLAVVVCLLLAMLPEVAWAHDHRPPRATLHIADRSKNGLLHHADGWARRINDRLCEATFMTGFPRFPRPLPHEPGDPIIVRFHKVAVPLEVAAYQWSGVDENGNPDGSPAPLPFTLRPVTEASNIVAWEVVVPLPTFDGHLYLGIDGYWADEDGCYGFPDLGSQYAAWTFHAISE